MPALDCPVHRQTVSQESTSLGPEEIPLPGRLMHHRAEFFGALSASQDTTDQTLGTARTVLPTTLFFRRLFLLPCLAFALELQADWKRMTKALHHLFGPLQVKKTARHVGIGVSFMDVALIGFQDGDFGLSPVTVLSSAPTEPIGFVAGPRRPTPSPPTGRNASGWRRRP